MVKGKLIDSSRGTETDDTENANNKPPSTARINCIHVYKSVPQYTDVNKEHERWRCSIGGVFSPVAWDTDVPLWCGGWRRRF